MQKQPEHNSWREHLRSLLPDLGGRVETSSKSADLSRSLPKIHTLPPLNGRGALLFDIAKEIHYACAKELGEVACYAVGGFVRDSLAGRIPRDLDLEIVAPLGDVVAALRRMPQMFVGTVRPQFDSVECLARNGEQIDIVCNRNSGRNELSDVVYTSAGKRGFSVNSMYCDVVTGEVLDFFGGESDLQQSRLSLLPQASFLADGRLFFSGVALIERFGLLPCRETLSELRSAGAILGFQCERDGTPNSLARLICKILERGVDLPRFLHRLARFGFFDPFFRRMPLGVKALHSLLDATANAVRDNSEVPLEIEFNQRLATGVGILVERAPLRTPLEEKHQLVEATLRGIGFIDSGIRRDVLRKLVTQQQRNVDGGRSVRWLSQMSFTEGGEGANSYAHGVFQRAPQNSKLARLQLSIEMLRKYLTGCGQPFRVFVGSRRFIENVDVNKDKPFLLVCGVAGFEATRDLALQSEWTLKARSPCSCSLIGRDGVRLDVLHIRKLPIENAQTSVIPIHRAEARERILSVRGALYDPARRVVFQLS